MVDGPDAILAPWHGPPDDDTTRVPPSMDEIGAGIGAIRACLKPQVDDGQVAPVMAWKRNVLARIEASEKRPCDRHRVAPAPPPASR